MAALVANYGSSDEDSDSNTEAKSDRNEVVLPLPVTQKKTNYFDGSDGSSSSDSENEKDSQTKGDKSKLLPNPLSDRLPTPGLDGFGGNQTGLVFRNPFEIAEQAKNSILEKHVKMTETKTDLTGAHKKKNVCYKFKKGKCHFGKNCKYSHDVEANISVKQTDSSTETSQELNSMISTNSDYGLGSSFGVPLPHEPEEDSYMANAKRKKRAGLAENLVPSKKAMSALNTQRKKERPWTFKK